MDNTMIYKATWLPEDHIEELAELLYEVSAEALTSRLTEYVADTIEPTGWKALWRSPGTSSFLTPELKIGLDFIVDVVEVSQESLEGTVILNSLEKSCGDGLEDIQICFQQLSLKKVNVPLTQLYVLAKQDDDVLDMETTAEVIEQVRFVLDHIMLPWDLFEEKCVYDRCLLQERITLYQNIVNGVISKDVASKMAYVKDQAKTVCSRIEEIESQADIMGFPEFDQTEVVELMSLNKTLEQLRSNFYVLKDPSLREIAVYQQQLERGDMVKSSISAEAAEILVVTGVTELEVFLKHISNLQQVLSQLSDMPSNASIQGFPSLQIALDVAKMGGTIVLLPGSHKLCHLGALANGGTIIGLGDGVVIEGDHSTGDVLIDITPGNEDAFILKSLTLHPLNEQVAISLHCGQLVMNNCNIKGGSVGVCLLQNTKSEITDCCFTGQNVYGIKISGDANICLQNSTFESCGKAAVVAEEGSVVELHESVKIKDCSTGVCVLRKNESDMDDPEDVLSKVLISKEKVWFDATEEHFSYSLQRV